MKAKGRHLLIVASQCAAEMHLADLAESARALADVLLDPDLGGCDPGLPDGTSLLLYKEADEVDALAVEASVNSAIHHADDKNAALILAFLGHGFVMDGASDLHFMAPRSLPDTPATGVNLPVLLTNATTSSGVSGVFAVVDTCQAGGAQPDFRGLYGKVRFSLLAASSINQQAYDLCLTKELVKLLRDGVPTKDDRLTQEALATGLRTAMAGSGQTLHTANVDTSHEAAALWLSRNRQRQIAFAEGEIGSRQLGKALRAVDPQMYADPHSWSVDELKSLRAKLALLESDSRTSVVIDRAKQAVVNMIVALSTMNFLRTWQGNHVGKETLRWALARRNPRRLVQEVPPPGLTDEKDFVDFVAFRHPTGDNDCRKSMVTFVLLLAKAANAAAERAGAEKPAVDHEALERWAQSIDAMVQLHDADEAIRAEYPQDPLRLVVSLHASKAGDWPTVVEGWLLQGGVQVGRNSVSLERPDQATVATALQDLIEWVDDQFSTDRLKRVDIAAPSALLLRWHPEETVVGGSLLGAAYEVTSHWSERIAPARHWRWIRKEAKDRMIAMGPGQVEAPIDWMTLQECLEPLSLTQSFQQRRYARGVGLTHHPGDDADLMDIFFCYSPVVVWPEQTAGLDADPKGRLDTHWDALPEAFTHARRQGWRGEPPHDLAGIRATWDDMEWLIFCERADPPKATDFGREQ